jgi:flavin reductase (DIM6/NTAB) family NADH-FMN oxidoreductase RutF
MSSAPMKSLDPGDLDPRDVYKLMISAIVPRPIALVSTVSESGITNVSPFSFFNGVASRPPIVAISISRGKDGEEKDTLRNIRHQRDFVVNVVDRALAAKAVASSAPFDAGTSEFAAVGLTAMPSDKVRSPRVAESPVHFECIAVDLVENPGGSDVTLVLGRVLRFHVARRLWGEQRLLPQELDPVGRLGGDFYATMAEPFAMRPDPAPRTKAR